LTLSVFPKFLLTLLAGQTPGALKMREWKMQEWKMREQIAGVENAGVENAGAIMRRNPSEEIP